MQFSELLTRRACVRSFKKAPITAEEVNAILSAGIRAPNACNLQSWHFYAVTDSAKISGAHDTVAHISWAGDIPLLIVVCIREEIATNLCERFGAERGRAFCEHDAAGAVNHMLLRAADLGLGGCWVGPMDEGKCKTHFGIAENHTPTAIVTIGKAASETQPHSRCPLTEAVTFVGDISSVPAVQTETEPFKLEHASLPGAVFEDLNLADAKFNNINLSGAAFSDINLRDSSFGGLTMAGARFGCVNLNGASFENPDFSDSTFKNCSFENTSIDGCKLSGMRIDGYDVLEMIEQIKKVK